MPSFDIVSKLEMFEVDNAVQQASKEITQRFDFKNTSTEIAKNNDGIVLSSVTEDRLKAGLVVLQEKLVRRKVSLKTLDPQTIEKTSGGGVKQLFKLKEGVSTEKGKEIVKFLKSSSIKVQASIQPDQVRVTGKKRDDLQAAIKQLKEKDFDIELQYINFRD